MPSPILNTPSRNNPFRSRQNNRSAQNANVSRPSGIRRWHLRERPPTTYDQDITNSHMNKLQDMYNAKMFDAAVEGKGRKITLNGCDLTREELNDIKNIETASKKLSVRAELIYCLGAQGNDKTKSRQLANEYKKSLTDAKKRGLKVTGGRKRTMKKRKRSNPTK